MLPSVITSPTASKWRIHVGLRHILVVLTLVAGGLIFLFWSPPTVSGVMAFGNTQPVQAITKDIEDTSAAKNQLAPSSNNLRMGLGVWDPALANIDDDISIDLAEDILMRYIADTDIICQTKRKVGGRKDLDDGWKMVCMEPPLNFKPNDCLIYSFGINNEWSFEDQIVSDFGCTIYAYDPSISAPAKRGEKITFQAIGLSGDDTRKKGWKMRTLGELLAENQHSDAVIDYLKIDIEGSEWFALQTAMKDGSLARAKQLAVEFHLHSLGNDIHSYRSLYKAFKSYRDYGFRPWAYWMNFYCLKQLPSGFRRSVCYELVYINERFLPQNNDS